MTDKIGQSRSPELIEVLRAAMDKVSEGISVALPGKIEKYDAAKQVADVKPLVKIPVVFDDGTEGLDTLPVIPSVPIVFPRGGGYYISFPLAKGDNVLLVFADRAIDSFVGSSGSVDVDPEHLRMHDLTDAVAIPGWYPTPKAIKDAISSGMVIGEEKGLQIRFTQAGVEVVSKGAVAAQDFVAMAAKNDGLWQGLVSALNLWAGVDAASAVAVANALKALPGYIQGTKSANLKAE
jgi:hypothetical protein